MAGPFQFLAGVESMAPGGPKNGPTRERAAGPGEFPLARRCANDIAQLHLLRSRGHNGREVSKVYPDSESHSQKLYDRALSSLPGGNTRTTVFMKPYPIYAARGEGCRVWDVDGSEFIDCINNFTSLIHGHAHLILVGRRWRKSQRWPDENNFE